MLLAPALDSIGPLEIRHVVVAGRDDHPSAANGVHGVARQIVREQRAAGHDARLILLTNGPAAADTEAERTIPLAGLSIKGRTVRLRAAAVDAVLAGAGPRTVFHIHGGREPLLIGLTRQMQRKGLPYGVTVHGRYSHVYDRSGACLKRSTGLYLGWVERGMLTRARFVQALSEAEARVLRRVAPGAAVAVVGNGAYSSRLGPAPALPEVRGASAYYPHFVFCGRYAVHHKGLDLLLHGFAAHRRAGGAGRLTLIGSGPARATLQAMAATLGVADAVAVGGPRFGADRDRVLAACDYFVMASRYEGLPLAGLEAAAAGLPLLMTEETGLGEAVRHYGAGIPIGALSAEGVQAALGRAASQSEAEWTGQRAAAHRMAIARGDWTRIADDLCALYRGGAEPGRARPARPAHPDSTTSL